jgi:hypothetical protein
MCYGATERNDRMIKISSDNYLLIFGFGSDDSGNGYNYRKYYDHCPTAAELKADIESLINARTDNTILTGYVFNGVNVWLSTENQFNFKAAYDIAVQTGGASLPVTFKLGETADGSPVYHTFDDIDEFTAFYAGAMQFVTAALSDGWKEKDSVDYEHIIKSC